MIGFPQRRPVQPTKQKSIPSSQNFANILLPCLGSLVVFRPEPGRWHDVAQSHLREDGETLLPLPGERNKNLGLQKEGTQNIILF